MRCKCGHPEVREGRFRGHQQEKYFCQGAVIGGLYVKCDCKKFDSQNDNNKKVEVNK